MKHSVPVHRDARPGGSGRPAPRASGDDDIGWPKCRPVDPHRGHRRATARRPAAQAHPGP